jgi:hypothetical protein
VPSDIPAFACADKAELIRATAGVAFERLRGVSGSKEDEIGRYAGRIILKGNFQVGN